MSHILASESQLPFILAGNARFTIQNTNTGLRFTYQVKVKKEHSFPFFVSVLSGPDNESDYRFFGCIWPGPVFRLGKNQDNGPSHKMFDWVFQHLIANDLDQYPQYLIHHEGRCGHCGRVLTTPESILTGIGPTCAAKTARK